MFAQGVVERVLAFAHDGFDGGAAVDGDDAIDEFGFVAQDRSTIERTSSAVSSALKLCFAIARIFWWRNESLFKGQMPINRD